MYKYFNIYYSVTYFEAEKTHPYSVTYFEWKKFALDDVGYGRSFLTSLLHIEPTVYYGLRLKHYS